MKKDIWQKIKCFLGFHKWGCLCGLKRCKANEGGYLKPRRCKCCNKVQTK